MSRRPAGLDPNLDQALREVWQAIDRLQKGGMVDMHGRRMGNAGTPVERRDYAHKGYIDDQLAQLREELKKDISKGVSRVTKIVGSGGGGGGTGGGGPVDFGYYNSISTQNGNYLDVVKPWTNIVYIGPVGCGDSSVAPSERDANLRTNIRLAAEAGFKIMLDTELHIGSLTIGAVLQAAQPHWDKVAYVILGDELSPDEFDVNNEIQLLKNRMNNLGLPARPIGATFTPDTVLTQNVGQYNFDFINIEAYTQPCVCNGCGASTAAAEIAAVANRMTQMKAAIPATKNLTVVMQAYNRNGAFANTSILTELNRATWFQMVKGDARIKALMMFAYWRENPSGCGTNHGTFGLPTLAAVHQEIWADMSGGATGGEKKCATDSRNCPGQPVCCEGAVTNPCNCPRLCEGGSYASMILLATQSTITAHPELFDGGLLISEAAALQFRSFVTIAMNTSNPALESIDDPADGKQVLTRARTAPLFREDYAVWTSDLRPRLGPGAYRATCYPGTF